MKAARWLEVKARAGRVLMALLIVSAAAGLLWYRRQASQSGPPLPEDIPISDRKAEMVTRDFRHVETRMDRTIWILEAKEAMIYENKTKLWTVKITWYGEAGSVPVVVTSDEGVLLFKSMDAVLTGKVRLERADGSVLTTDELQWSNSVKMLRSRGPVLITTPTFTFQGDRLEADLEQQKFRIDGQVQGDFKGGSARPHLPS